MIIKSNKIDQAHLEHIANQMGIIIYKFVYKKHGMQFTLRPRHGSKVFRRTNQPRLSGHYVNLWAVCWHGHKHFMLKVFNLDPKAVIKTALATYDGIDSFNQTFEDTGNNWINGWSGMTYRDTCNCEKEVN